MGSPMSGTMAEIFLQYIENRHLKQLLDSKNIIFYTRYVDDIFIIYDTTRTTAYSIHNYINNIHNCLQLKPTYENNTQINFLDLCIIRKTNKLEIDIYRKPTTTDITINYLSNHPIEHKLAAYRYHINRKLTLPLTKERRTHEWKTIQNIARNNNFPNKLITNLKQQIQPNTTHQKSDRKENINNTKWATFTYYSPKVRKVTNIFKQTDIKIAFKNNNTISQILRPKATNNTPIYNKSGIYKLTCKTCQHVYVGQTSRNLKQRYQEHIRYIRNNDPQSAFAQHILNNQHEYGTIEEIMKLLKPTNHTSMLIPYELFFIQSHHQHGQLISEQNPGELNPLIQLGIDTIQTHVTT